jgi:ketosteroid isomerase-like protein
MSTGVEIGELQTAYDALVAAAVSQNAEEYAAQYVDDGVLMVPHSPAVRGRAALLGWLKAFFANWSIEIDSMSFEGVAIGDRVAFVRWNAAGRYVPREGEGVPFDQKYLDTLVREPGGPWRFAAHMANSNVEAGSIWPSWRRLAEAHDS